MRQPIRRVCLGPVLKTWNLENDDDDDDDDDDDGDDDGDVDDEGAFVCGERGRVGLHVWRGGGMA